MEAPISEYIRRATAPVFLLVLVVSLPLTLDHDGARRNFLNFVVAV